MLTALGMNPHTKLEFAKMTIRTKALELMRLSKRQAETELKAINDEIQLNTILMTRHHDENSQNILANEIDELSSKRDIILQKQGTKLACYAKTKWYNEGERSNKYFLNLLKRRAIGGEMTKLADGGTEITDESEIREKVTEYYQTLYNSDEEVYTDPQFLNNMFEVAPQVNNEINAPITLGELWANLKHTKATTPGHDGLSNTYLKRFWNILGPLIVDAWNYSITINELPPSHKQSLLNLIPKTGKDIKQLKNWRPITLSNCDHKLITRTYNNRLLRAISSHITPTQTAYIKGRNIADNLHLLNE
jgi:hypothetical protein